MFGLSFSKDQAKKDLVRTLAVAKATVHGLATKVAQKTAPKAEGFVPLKRYGKPLSEL